MTAPVPARPYFRYAVGVLALVLIPALMYVEVTQLAFTQGAHVAFWAPIIVIAADALLFWFALGAWMAAGWDRAGIALVLPLLIAMASWALMIDMVPMPPTIPVAD